MAGGARTHPYRILDHTADIGVEVHGKDLKALFENAGKALFHLVTDLRTVRRRVEKQIRLKGEPLERLMVDWLSELLYLHDVEHLLFRRFEVDAVGERGLRARAFGEVFREGVHVVKTGVKAVTYHQIQVKREGEGWRSRIIFDL